MRPGRRSTSPPWQRRWLAPAGRACSKRLTYCQLAPFGFHGSYTDPSGLIYLIDRYYDPSTDQFLSVDPDLADTGQPYAFIGDDPLNATDPLGLRGAQHNALIGCMHDKPGSKKDRACITAAKKQNAEGPIDDTVQRLLKQARRDPIAMAIANAPFALVALPLAAAAAESAGPAVVACVIASCLILAVSSDSNPLSDSGIPVRDPTIEAPAPVNIWQESGQMWKDVTGGG